MTTIKLTEPQSSDKDPGSAADMGGFSFLGKIGERLRSKGKMKDELTGKTIDLGDGGQLVIKRSSEQGLVIVDPAQDDKLVATMEIHGGLLRGAVGRKVTLEVSLDSAAYLRVILSRLDELTPGLRPNKIDILFSTETRAFYASQSESYAFLKEPLQPAQRRSTYGPTAGQLEYKPTRAQYHNPIVIAELIERDHEKYLVGVIKLAAIVNCFDVSGIGSVSSAYWTVSGINNSGPADRGDGWGFNPQYCGPEVDIRGVRLERR